MEPKRTEIIVSIAHENHEKKQFLYGKSKYRYMHW